MPGGPPGTVWASGSWDPLAWEADTWADARPPGPVGSVWAPGTWSDTAWVANSWADVFTGGGVTAWSGVSACEPMTALPPFWALLTAVMVGGWA